VLSGIFARNKYNIISSSGLCFIEDKGLFLSSFIFLFGLIGLFPRNAGVDF
jgi:hypothetical protein